jgi:uncharacterized protein YeaO (DUF488 family)/DNA-binding MarR family transcriptional regulator
MATKALSDDDYRRLLAFRDGLRRFEHWSEQRALEAGLTTAQHQLLLAIRGHGDERGPTIGEVADHLLLRHHSAVELVKRAEESGLISRSVDRDDRRVVRLHLSAKARALLRSLSVQHLAELNRLGSDLAPLWSGIGAPQRRGGRRKSWDAVSVQRVYDAVSAKAGARILVDRLWPRGIPKSDPRVGDWMPDVAPSTELRKWYGHQEPLFAQFAERYRKELRDRGPELEILRSLMAKGPLTLLTATRDVEHSAARVLAGELDRLGPRRSGARSS